MITNLFVQATTKFLFGVVLMCLLIFLPAGTLCFTNGWILMCILFIPMFFAGIVMMFKNPGLLKKRLNVKENHAQQKIVIYLSAVMFISGFVVAGLNFRFGWHVLPKSIVCVSVLVFVLAYLLFAEIMRENKYLSRTIEIQKDQKIIDTGLYKIVRHPMYSATLFMFLAMPLILGSVFAFLIFLFYPFIIAKRIKHEEDFLKKELNGYKQYTQKVKYRLIPFIW